MIEELRMRLLMIFALTVVGVSLALTSSALGAAGVLSTPDSNPQFTVTADTVSLSHDDQERTVLDNVSRTERVEISQSNPGEYTVQAESKDPISDADRRRTLEIVQNNDTLSEQLGDLDQYEIDVQPVQKLETESGASVEGTIQSSNSSEDDEIMLIENFSAETNERDGTVVVDRTPSYVEDEVSVRLRDATTDEAQYSITVDLANETVVDVTNWEEI